jgi:GNAT superfamily N-acetyltransferase
VSDAERFAASGLELVPAQAADLHTLEPFVRAYHEFEHIASTPEARRRALEQLLENAALGRIWLIKVGDEPVGYIALCFGYTIEFAGLDAFVDEFYIVEAHRGRGLGGLVLERIADEAQRCSVRALHLEVARTNEAAVRVYRACGFVVRDRYHLMTRDLA